MKERARFLRQMKRLTASSVACDQQVLRFHILGAGFLQGKANYFNAVSVMLRVDQDAWSVKVENSQSSLFESDCYVVSRGVAGQAIWNVTLASKLENLQRVAKHCFSHELGYFSGLRSAMPCLCHFWQTPNAYSSVLGQSVQLLK